MKDKINSIKNWVINNNIIIIIIFLLLAFNITRWTTMLEGDDYVYKEAFNDIPTMISWAKEFANVWSGRIIATAVSTIFLNINITVFKIINALMILLLVYMLYKFVRIGEKKKNKSILLVLSMILFFFIHPKVIEFGIVWITGTFNYLWPCAFMIIALIPYVKLIKEIKIKKWEYIFYIIASIYASNVEQTGAILLVFGAISIGYTILKKYKLNIPICITYLISSIIAIVSLLLPGNTARARSRSFTLLSKF